MLLQPMLRARVQWCAGRSHGWFKAKHPHSGRGQFVKWNEEAGMSEQVAWASTKTFKRSMAKVALVYQFEAARMCDVTRETIWFDSLGNLYKCLMHISWDRWAVILQVKNALDPAACPHETGGFRYVKLLVRLETPRAKELGLDGHVCEVLLVLKQFEEARLEGGHARYTAWRDLRSAHIRQRSAPSRSLPSPLLSLARFFPLPSSRASEQLPRRSQTGGADVGRGEGTGKEEGLQEGLQEEVARIASQEEAARELDWRRGHRSMATRGLERRAVLEGYADAMKDYLWGANNEVYGTIGKRRTTIEAATHSSAFVGCFRMKQALVAAIGLLLLFLALSALSSSSSSSSAWLDDAMLAMGRMGVGGTMVVAAGLGHLKMASKALQAVKWMVLLHILAHAAVIASLLSHHLLRPALHLAASLVSIGVWLLLVHYAPHTVLEAFVTSGCISFFSTLALRASVYGLASGIAVLLDPVAGIYIVSAVGCKALVLWAEYKSEQAFQRDVLVYEAIWKEILDHDRSQGVLDKLKFCTDQIEARIAGAGGPVRQGSLQWHHSMDHEPEALDAVWWRECALWASAELLARAPPTLSIDQLYAQAEVASVVMRHKLKRWAVGSKGLFLRKKAVAGCQRHQWARAAELLSGEEEDISWGPLKRESRAIEKAFRCYGGDVSRLVDLSRHSIVFEEPEQMLQCLELLVADPDVHVLRIKNELHPSQQGSCGYRQVLLNVAIVSDKTQRMGVSMHASEIQLLPLKLALAKTDDGHRRYVLRRNARGE